MSFFSSVVIMHSSYTVDNMIVYIDIIVRNDFFFLEHTPQCVSFCIRRKRRDGVIVRNAHLW